MQSRARSPWILLRAVIALACAGGCSNAPYDLAQVTGKVTIDGQPFCDGKVMFAPIAKGDDHKSGRPAFGRVDSQGNFSLSTYAPGDGAVVGEHWVTLIHIQPTSDGAAVRQVVSTPRDALKFSRMTVPSRVTVCAGKDNRIDVNVTRQEVAKFAMTDR